jgi:hypothetical protein
MNIEQRKQLSLTTINWKGDLSDDCTAKWAGLMLRAEFMNEEYWCWVVYDMQRSEITVESSNRYDESFLSGNSAREKAEAVAKNYIDILTSGVIAQFIIKDVLKITNKGLVFAGYIQHGSILPNNIIEFTDGCELHHKRIIGVEGIRSLSKEINVGLLIDCKNETEMNYFKDVLKPNPNAIIFQSYNQ